MDFESLGLSEPVLKAVADAGYTTPTPIQAQAIPVVLMGRDVLGTAQTGTGKTAGFTLPLIDILAGGRARARMPRALILEPTRELADQVAQSFDRYGKNSPLSMALLIGGVNYSEQEKLLDRGVDVLIATPGRLLDLFERGKILLSDVKIFVIDESDRMLDMGFIPDVEKIAKLLPRMRQTLLFSATMPPEIKRLTEAFMINPKQVTVAPPATASATIEQWLVTVAPDAKREALRRLLRSQEVKNAFIFCNRKRDVAVLYKSLTKHGFNAGQLHGDMAQPQRMATLDQFRKGELPLLVCSDVAARGIDIDAVSHVFNFDVPFHAEDYVHRIGRTGRAGLTGHAITLASPEDGKSLAAISRLVKQDIPKLDLPELAELAPGAYTAEDRPRRSRGESRGEERAAGGRGERRGRGREREQDEDRPAGVRTRARVVRVRDHAPEPVETPAEPVRMAEPMPAAEPEAPVARERNPYGRVAEGGRSAPTRGVERGGPRQPEPPRDRDRRRRDHDDDEPVVGFADHIPAFLLRSARPGANSRRRPAAEVADEA